jgi:hypothetical protein
MLDEMGSMRDDMQVLTAMVMRLDGTVGLVLTELRAMHSQHSASPTASAVSRRSRSNDRLPLCSRKMAQSDYTRWRAEITSRRPATPKPTTTALALEANPSRPP